VGVASLVLGILALVLALIPSFGYTALLGVVLGIAALILGIVGRKQAVERGEKTGVATAGVVLGIIGLIFSALIFAACQYCQHKVGKAINKGIKSGAFIAEIMALQTCTEVSAGRCKNPTLTFSADTPRIQVIYRTKFGGEKYVFTWQRVRGSGSLRSYTTIDQDSGTFEKIGDFRVGRGELKRPPEGYTPGTYRVRVRVGSRTSSKSFSVWK